MRLQLVRSQRQSILLWPGLVLNKINNKKNPLLRNPFQNFHFLFRVVIKMQLMRYEAFFLNGQFKMLKSQNYNLLGGDKTFNTHKLPTYFSLKEKKKYTFWNCAKCQKKKKKNFFYERRLLILYLSSSRSTIPRTNSCFACPLSLGDFKQKNDGSIELQVAWQWKKLHKRSN